MRTKFMLTLPLVGVLFVSCNYDDENGGAGYTITVNSSDNGSVTSVPANLTSVEPGSQVTLTPVPDEGFVFDGWDISGEAPEGFDAEENPLVFTMPEGAIEITANFVPEGQQGDNSVTIGESENGSVTSNPADLSDVEPGTEVTLTPVPDEGFVFDGWTLGPDTEAPEGFDAEENPLVFTMPEGAFEITAVFAPADNVLDDITDASFKSYLEGRLGEWDENDDDMLSVDEALNVKDIDLTGLGVAALDGIENFTGLEELDLDGTDLSGSNLLDFATFPLLKVLSIVDGSLEGVLDLTDLDVLTKLTINGNPLLTGINIPTAPLLSIMDVADNLLSGDLDLSGLTGLTQLIANNNKLTGVTLAPGVVLTLVNLAGNLLDSLVLDGGSTIDDLDVSDNPTLSLLDITGNLISSLNLSGNTGLLNLIAKDNKLVDLDLGDNTGLEVLDLSENQLADLDLGGLLGLEVLDLSENQLVDLDLGDNDLLTSLNLAGNSGLGLPDLSGLLSLTDLNLADTGLAGALNLSFLTNLTDLVLSDNGLLSGLIFSNANGDGLLESIDLSGLTGLLDLDLSGNSGLGDLLDISGLLSGLLSLESLNLADTGLTGALNLSFLTNLTDLVLADNGLLSGLTFSNADGEGLLESIDLSGLTGLLNLDLSGNGLLSVLDLTSSDSLNSLDVTGITGLVLNVSETLLDTITNNLLGPLGGLLGGVLGIVNNLLNGLLGADDLVDALAGGLLAENGMKIVGI